MRNKKPATKTMQAQSLRLESLEPRVLLSVFVNAEANGPYEIFEGSDLLQLDGSGSVSLLPFATNFYSWDLNNDGIFETQAGTNAVHNVPWAAIQPLGLPSDGTESPINLQFLSIGFVPQLVIDFDTDSSTLAIINLPPTADAGGPYVINEGEPLWLDASGSSDPGNDPLEYHWDLDGNFTVDLTTINPIPFVPWEQLEALGLPGDGVPINMHLWVFDGDGGVGDTAAPLVINNVAPNVNVGGPYVIFEGQGLQLSGEAQDPNANDLMVAWLWDLDDDNLFDDAFGPNPFIPWNVIQTHLALNPGMDSDGTSMEFSLAVMDNNGGIGVGSGLVFVVDNLDPLVGAGGPYEINEGDMLPLSAVSFDFGGDPLTFLWDLDNDGVYDDAAGSSNNLPWSTLQTLGLPSDGSLLNISVKALDGDGGVGFAGTTLIINNQPPVPDAGGPYEIMEGQSLWVDAHGTFDPDSNDTLVYAWDINGDGTVDFFAGDSPIVQIPWDVIEAAGVIGHPATNPVILKLIVGDLEGNGQAFRASVQTDLIVNNVNPNADVGGPYWINEGDDLQLHGLGSDPNANDLPLMFAWDLDNDGDYDDAFGQDPLIPWGFLQSLILPDGSELPDDGTSLVVGLKVTEASPFIPEIEPQFENELPPPLPLGFSTEHRELALVIQNVAPSVDAGGPYTIVEGENLQLLGSGNDPGKDPLTFLWDLDNDGAFDDAAGQTPIVSWDHLKLLNLRTDGSPNPIALMADDGEEHGVNIAISTLVITNAPPSAEAGPDITINEGDVAHFFGSFTDPYGPLDSSYIFNWDFGDIPPALPANTEHAAHTYLDDTGGPFTATFSVTDKDGGTGTDSLLVTVLNVTPVVDAGDARVSEEGKVVPFSGKFTDVGINDTHTLLWDFGDGATDSSGLEVQHTYADNGTYTVTLTVTDDDGGVGVDSFTMIVFNKGPWVYAGPAKGIDEGDTVNFSEATFSDVLADIPPASIVWDFGDGSPLLAGVLNPSHTYVEDGVYTAKLTVDDGDDVVSSDAHIIVNNVGPSNVVAGPDEWTTIETPFTFSGSFTDPGINDTHTYLWNFGDGHTSTGTLTPTHEYAESGLFSVTLIVSDDDGAHGIDIMEMEVREYLPIVNNRAFFHTIAGDLVSVRLKGPGELVEVIHVGGTGEDFKDIVLQDTTDRSALVIRSTGHRRTAVDLGDLHVHSSLGRFIAPTTNLKGDVEILTGELGKVVLNSIEKDGTLTTGLGGINSLKTRYDIAGTVNSATSINRILSVHGGITQTGSVIANQGNINNARFATGVDGLLSASEKLGRVSSPRGVLTGTLRAGDEINNVMFGDIHSATISSGGNINRVISRNSIVDTAILASYDIGPDGLPFTADDTFNTAGATIGRVAVHPSKGIFDGSNALAGVKPFDFDPATGTWTMLNPVPALQERAGFGAINNAIVGQVFLNGDPFTGIYGLFAATEPLNNVIFTEITASGAPDFELRSIWL